MRHPNPFIQSDIEDTERTARWLNKEDMSRDKQWIVRKRISLARGMPQKS